MKGVSMIEVERAAGLLNAAENCCDGRFFRVSGWARWHFLASLNHCGWRVFAG